MACPYERGRNYTPVKPVRCVMEGASCGKWMIARSVPAPVNHHGGSYISPALAAASYLFVALPIETPCAASCSRPASLQFIYFQERAVIV